MFVKIAIITLLAVIATAHEEEKLWDNFRTKWYSEDADDYFYDLPANMSEAEATGNWTDIDVDCSHFPNTVPKCYQGDRRFVLIYNTSSGALCGFQFAIPVQEMKDENVTFNYSANAWWINQTFNGSEWYTVTTYWYEGEGQRSIWFVKQGNELQYIPTKIKELEATTGYNKKACLPLMGMHWYAFTNTTKECDFTPMSVVSYDGVDVHGIDITAMGWQSFLWPNSGRNWTDPIPAYLVPEYIPSMPGWLQAYIIDQGFMSCHMWLRNPTTVTQAQCDSMA